MSLSGRRSLRQANRFAINSSARCRVTRRAGVELLDGFLFLRRPGKEARNLDLARRSA
jgi:hypothetical protein